MTWKRFAPLLIAGTVTVGPTVAADVPDYDTLDLRVRSNLCVNKGGPGSPVFNLPCDTFFTSNTPDINDSGSVAISLGIVEGGNTEGVFLWTSASADIVYESAGEASVGDVMMNNDGDIVWDQFFSNEDGLWLYDASTGTAARETTAPLGASGWGSPGLNDSGQIGYRASFAGDHAYVSYDDGSTMIHATEVGIDVDSRYSFLFTPSFNNNRQIAGKARVGGPGEFGNDQPDEIRIFESDGTSTLIAEDSDGDPGSPYSGFDNSVALNNNGWVAFNANLKPGGRGVFLSDGSTTITIATTNDPQVSSIESFGPDVNDSNLVVFRAVDGSSLQTVYVGDGTTLRAAMREHDLVDTDLGAGRIDQHNASPVFGGGPAINNHGAVVMNAALTPENNDQIEWGSGLLVAGKFGDLTGDLLVNVFDLLELLANWGSDGPGADLDEPNDVVNVFDLLALLSAWG